MMPKPKPVSDIAIIMARLDHLEAKCALQDLANKEIYNCLVALRNDMLKIEAGSAPQSAPSTHNKN